MPTITYVTQDGRSMVVDAADGTLMSAAVEHQVPGILGDCGGVCSCATCHVKVDPDWLDKVGGPSDAESDMLELEEDVDERSRLGCQVKLHHQLDGLVVHVVGS